MSNITVEQFDFLKQYDRMLHTMSEGFEYLEENLTEEAPPQVEQVFADIVTALQQLNQGNEKLASLLEDRQDEVQQMLVDFQDIVELMSQWFDKQTNEEKRVLLTQQIIPYFESWRSKMHQLLQPYIAH
ncbi:hypothetical protein [Pontibacillus yanchengensis]|uniref:DUF8042 domain-containing protein n=1 Tax=Pontibacillus yanchengensis Y32 TaxID=1385514 RepID=A0A0A2THQ4_9BACI|nr:hypothetical protein [Pontibacillus yanchengensis]KGP73606.1 hypothetical protein N782_03860 [Pontibacillus yanchengensis Y32]